MKNLSNVNEKTGVLNENISDGKNIVDCELKDIDMEVYHLTTSYICNTFRKFVPYFFVFWLFARVKGDNADSETDSEGQMVDGILSSGPKSTYEQPSQEELVRRAFAGDDVEEYFEKDKEEVLNAENPEPEKPTLLPGWGQWTNIQKQQGLPSWMLEEHKTAKKKREEALKKRRDACLNHVIISEKLGNKVCLHLRCLINLNMCFIDD